MDLLPRRVLGFPHPTCPTSKSPAANCQHGRSRPIKRKSPALERGLTPAVEARQQVATSSVPNSGADRFYASKSVPTYKATSPAMSFQAPFVATHFLGAIKGRESGWRTTRTRRSIPHRKNRNVDNWPGKWNRWTAGPKVRRSKVEVARRAPKPKDPFSRLTGVSRRRAWLEPLDWARWPRRSE